MYTFYRNIDIASSVIYTFFVILKQAQKENSATYSQLNYLINNILIIFKIINNN